MLVRDFGAKVADVVGAVVPYAVGFKEMLQSQFNGLLQMVGYEIDDAVVIRVEFLHFPGNSQVVLGHAKKSIVG